MSDITIDATSSYGSTDFSSDFGSPGDFSSAAAASWNVAWADAGLRTNAGSGGSTPVATNDVTDVQFTPIASREFATPQQAAVNAIEGINPTSVAENREYTGKVRLDPLTGLYYADPPIPGDMTKAKLEFDREADQLTIGDYHTHRNYTGYDSKGNEIVGDRHNDAFDSENFSRNDRTFAAGLSVFLGKPEYFLWLGTPSGAVKQWDTLSGQNVTLKPGT